VTNPWVIDSLDLTVRMLLALLLGGLIGFEREKNNHPAGFRTHILVCLGSALLMLLSIYGFSAFVKEPNVRLDPARLAAQVIPGIGFLGAGTILRNGFNVTGLTTAASLWVASAIGLAAGAGFYYGAFLTTGMALLSLWILNNVEKKFFSDKRTFSMKIGIVNKPGNMALISSKLEAKGVSVRKMVIDEVNDNNEPKVEMTLLIRLPRPNTAAELMDEMRQLNGVTGISMETI
jgi:putative Mg2+ transporter-C (MgtC) family protein